MANAGPPLGERHHPASSSTLDLRQNDLDPRHASGYHIHRADIETLKCCFKIQGIRAYWQLRAAKRAHPSSRVHGLEWSGRAGGCVDAASLSCVLLRPYG